MSKILIVIAPQGYQDREYEGTKSALEKAGHTTITCSSVPEAKGKLGGAVKSDILLKDANETDYDAVAFIGGPGSVIYFDDQSALDLTKNFFNSGKLTCAICAAPSILANAGVLQGVKATCFPSEAQNLQSKGANYTGSHVEQDGKIITADGPDAARNFGEKISENL